MQKIFGREVFRCARCDPKVFSYCNIDDLTDPRAVARLERLEREANDDLSLGDDEDEEKEPDN
jgi:hypothetical protein